MWGNISSFLQEKNPEFSNQRILHCLDFIVFINQRFGKEEPKPVTQTHAQEPSKLHTPELLHNWNFSFDEIENTDNSLDSININAEIWIIPSSFKPMNCSTNFEKSTTVNQNDRMHLNPRCARTYCYWRDSNRELSPTFFFHPNRASSIE